MYEIEILDPTIVSTEARPQLTPRPADLDGKVVAALWNGRPQEDLVLREILAQLEKRYRLRGTKLFRKPQLYTSAPEDLIDEIVEQADAVITGVGT